jgi:probable F420-dependent oxidoreductase
MLFGFNLPQIGPAANLSSIVNAAKRAESLGYDSLWVTERLLYPIKPSIPYAWSADGSFPEAYKRVLDPLEVLTFAAAQTTRVKLATSVLDIPYYNPVTLARRLTTLDVLSAGRLRIGLGQGWSPDEHIAAGASMKERGPRADEFIKVLKAIWTTDPVEFHGKYFHVPKSIIQPKPVQKPHPPIYLAANSPSALKRAATLADGWNPVAVPIDGLKQITSQLKNMVREAGRKPEDFKVVLRANLNITQEPVGKDRWMFSGILEQIGEDIAALRNLGIIDELFFDPSFSPDTRNEQDFLRHMEQVRKLL